LKVVGVFVRFRALLHRCESVVFFEKNNEGFPLLSPHAIVMIGIYQFN
jgi:hypothetical protein